MYIKNLLKTTAALATLMVGSQSWGAVEYQAGVDVEKMRTDVVVISATTGDFNGYTNPASSTTKLHLCFVNVGTPTAASSTATTGVIPSTVKEIYLTGDATGLNTVIGTTKANALPAIPSGATIYFNFTKSPAAAVSFWFTNDIDSTHTLVFLKPILTNDYLGKAKKWIVGASLTIPATLSCSIERSSTVPEKEAATKARLTLAGATTFPGTVKGVSISGSNTVTCNDDCEFVDPDASQAVSAFTVASGKKLTIKGVSSNYASLPAVTLGAKSSVAVINAK